MEGWDPQALADDNCTTCGGTGYEQVGPMLFHVRTCPCVLRNHARAVAAKRIELYMPTHLRAHRFDNFNPGGNDLNEIALKAARNYVKNFETILKAEDEDGDPQPQMLGFSGPPSCGKTHLASAIARQLIAEGKVKTVCIETLERLVNSEKESWRDKSNESLKQRAMTADFTVIDDIGVEKGTDFEVKFMFDLLNERIVNRRPTLWTSNLSHAELRAKYEGNLDTQRVWERFARNQIMESLTLRKVKDTHPSSRSQLADLLLAD